MSHLCLEYSDRIVQSVHVAPLFSSSSENKNEVPAQLIRNQGNCIKRRNNNRSSQSIRNNSSHPSGNTESKSNFSLLLSYSKMNKGQKTISFSKRMD